MHSGKSSKVVLLNDTRTTSHIGCQTVMETIEKLVEHHGGVVIARCPVNRNWREVEGVESALREADIVLINGEGTFHHGQPRARRLLEAGKLAADNGARVALINTLYQENPPDWSPLLQNLSLICARDSRSHAELKKVYDGHLYKAVDLSMYESPPVESAQGGVGKNRIFIGDSVDRSLRKQLLKLSQTRKDFCFLPVLSTMKTAKPSKIPGVFAVRKLLVSLHQAWFTRRYRSVVADSKAAFIQIVRDARVFATGRFHAVCLALVAEAPVIAVTSNSWKIEALFEDLGVEQSRIVGIDDLPKVLDSDKDFSLTERERENISAALLSSRKTVDGVFAELFSESLM